MGQRAARARRLPVVVVALVGALALTACSRPVAPAASLSASPSPSQAPTVTRPPDPFPSDTAALPASDPALPFDPSAAPALPGRLVFAHYLPFFTRSIDNLPPARDYYATAFLAPGGENGVHAAYGGFLRDRPVPRAPLAGADWQRQDLEHEVRSAVAAGLDGFTLDLLAAPGRGDRRVLSVQSQLLDAAHAVDPAFRVMLMPDMATGMGGVTASELAAYVAGLGRAPAAMHLADGRLVVAPFTAENRSVAWWRQFLELMRTRYGTTVAFVPLLQDVQRHLADFAPISYGMSDWGGRSPAVNPVDRAVGSPIWHAEEARARGLLWMQTVSVQDERPYAGEFAEAQNTQNLRNTWQIARSSGAEWVQVATWNDYAEGSAVGPSVHHGDVLLDLVSYYATWFKTGAPPPILRDAVYLTHRTQPWAARPIYPETELMTPRDGSPPRDTVEALVLLTAPASVRVTVGGATTTCALPAGVNVCVVPLRVGRVSASVVRGTGIVASVTSPFPVTDRPRVQDLQYVAAGDVAGAPSSP